MVTDIRVLALDIDGVLTDGTTTLKILSVVLDTFGAGYDGTPVVVSFGGGGSHFCLGAHLARNEIRAMFDQLLTRYPQVEIVGPPTYLVSAPEQAIAVALRELPVRLAP